MRILTSSAMKIAESIAVEKGSSYSELMERAGKGASELIEKICDVSGKKITILCGKGNNAGDGLVAGRYLSESGAKITVIFAMGNELSPLAHANLVELKKYNSHFLDSQTPIKDCFDALQNSDILIDAVFGTGFNGNLPEYVTELFKFANSCRAIKISLDIPSGIDCDTGFYDENSFKADYTYTFATLKPAHILKSSSSLCGKIKIVDIKINETDISAIPDNITLLNKEIISDCIPKRKDDSNKGDYGRLLNIGASVNMTGAIILSSLAALRLGVGLVKIAAPQPTIPVFAAKIPECIYSPMPTNNVGAISLDGLDQLHLEMHWANTILIGCGLSICDDTKLIVEDIIQNFKGPMVIDADGLNCIADNPSVLTKASAPIIVTPHIKEMSRLTGLSIEIIKKRRFDVAVQFAEKYNVTVILKDSNTVIATPKREIFINQNGNSGLAKGGSGDVLAGMVASFLSQGASPSSAAVSGVYLHAEAGDITAKALTPYAMLPSDVIDSIPFSLKQIL